MCEAGRHHIYSIKMAFPSLPSLIFPVSPAPLPTHPTICFSWYVKAALSVLLRECFCGMVLRQQGDGLGDGLTGGGRPDFAAEIGCVCHEDGLLLQRLCRGEEKVEG